MFREARKIFTIQQQEFPSPFECSLKLLNSLTTGNLTSPQFQSLRAGSHINLIICTHRKNPEQEVSQTSAEVVQFLRYVLAVLSPEIVLFEQNASLRFQGMPFTDRSYLRNYRRRSRLRTPCSGFFRELNIIISFLLVTCKPIYFFIAASFRIFTTSS